MARIVCPFGIYYPGSVGFADLARSAKNSPVDKQLVDTFGRYRNTVAIDCLEYATISCYGGNSERVCTRTSVFIPWTPAIYIAVQPKHLHRLRSDINLVLCMNNSGNFVSSVLTTARSNVRSLVRASDRIIWSFVDTTLYEFRFDSFASRAVALRFLKENAHSRSHHYTLFATVDSTCFEVALASYFRRRLGPRQSDEAANSFSREDEQTERCDDDGATTIDLSDTFEMGAWCRVNDAFAETEQYVCKLSRKELIVNRLPKSPLLELPVVTYDIETIARHDSTLPRGVEEDQKLTSVAITIHRRRSDKSQPYDDDVEVNSIVLVYTPLADEEETSSKERLIERKMRESSGMENTHVRFYRKERDLLFNTLEILTTNEFFVNLYKLDEPADAERIACIFLGYNSWEYDYTFLTNRALYYGLNCHALQLLRLHREPRFCATQLSFDLMLHVKARYSAQVGSVSLKNVSRFFGATEAAEKFMNSESRQVKMLFDAVSIRHMYYRRRDDDDDSSERDDDFDSDMAFEENASLDSGVNMFRVLMYNVQDCTAVYHLMRNLCFLQTVSLYARHFYVTLVEASHAGNSKLLPNAFAVHALKDSNTILPFRQNRLSLCVVPRLPEEDVVVANSKIDDVHAAVAQNVMPLTPRQMLRWHRGDRSSSREAVYDQLRLMRIDEDKVYLGGINSAISGHYT